VNKELELWKFIADRLKGGQAAMLLVVAESSGSSPGRQGYKMAVGSDGELCGSIGGGVMEVNLVNQSRSIIGAPAPLPATPQSGESVSAISEQVHRKNSRHASGMICSGKQTVIFKLLTPGDSKTVDSIVESLISRTPSLLKIAPNDFVQSPPTGNPPVDFQFEKLTETDFAYREKLGFKNDLYIVGGGHCALALSELMSKMDFHISIFDDRPELNTIEKNKFAHEIRIIDGYDKIGVSIPSGANIYVVVMTLGYRSDEIVIRQLMDKNFRYFGVLGSKAKMATLMKELRAEGFDEVKLTRIHTPIGLPINSHTPEEIAVSIAAEIIAVKNSE